MLLSAFKGECLKFDDAQFLIAIALSFLGEKDAYEGVLTFLPLGNITQSAFLPTVVSERKKVEKIINDSPEGNLRALLNYFASNKVLEVKVVKGRVFHTLEKVSLMDLLIIKDLEVIYQKCMQLLLKNTPSEFIYLYTKTEEFMKVFASDLRKKFSLGANGYSYNVLSDSIVDEIAVDFGNYILAYSTRDETYLASSCTPIAFLRNAFNNFYVPSGKIYKILNSRGQDYEISDDGATALDFVGERDLKPSVTLNFVDICSKINQASRLLFSHNGNVEAFYDIYSYHRDRVVKSSASNFLKTYKSRLGDSCKIVYNSEDVRDDIGHRDSIISKKNGRIALCQICESIITNGISRSGIYPLYQRLINATNQQLMKNGARLFRTGASVTKHEESNGEMLQILIDGYIALRKLLQYLGSGQNKCGVTVNSFPVQIFRDSRYLKRFNNLEDYIAYSSNVSALVDEVSNDQVRSRSYLNGLFDNDTVYDMLAKNSIVHNTEFSEWRNMPINYIPTAIRSVMKCNEDEILYKSLVVFVTSIKSCSVSQNIDSVVSSLDYKTLLAELLARAKVIVAAPAEDIYNYRNIKVSIEFFKLLERVMRMEGHPFVNDSDHYLLERGTIQDEFLYLQTLAEQLNVSFDEVFKESYLYRIIALHKLLLAFTGVDKTNGFTATYEDMRVVLSILEVYTVYMGMLFTLVSSLNFGQRDTYLALAAAARQQDLIELPRQIGSIQEIAFLFKNGARQFSIVERCSAEECAAISERRNQSLVIAMNKLLSTIDHYDFIENLNRRAQLALKEVGSLKVDVEIETRLREADASIMARLLNGDVSTAKQMQMLSLFAEFDDLNYVMSKSGRLCANSTYYHKCGYKVIKRKELDSVMIKPMGDDDVHEVELALKLGV